MGGHCSTISSALENFSGSKRERLQSVDGCVLCSIPALTDIGKGRKQEGVKEAGRQAGRQGGGRKWFNLGWALKSFRERVVKM